MGNESMITIVTNDGKEIECEILFTFQNGNDNFVCYTDNSVDNENNIRAFCSKYTIKDEEVVLSSLNDTEVELVTSMVKKFRK